MKRLIPLLLLPLFAFAAPKLDPSLENKPPTVKVLLTKLANEEILSTSGPFFAYNPLTNELLFEGSKRKRGELHATEKGILWGNARTSAHAIRIVPASKEVRISVGGVPYPGCVEVHVIGGTLNIVNEVSVEQFLRVTLPSRVPNPCALSVLDALAIVERTRLYHLIEKEGHASFHIEQNGETYEGYKRQNRKGEEVIGAINRTANMVMTHQKKPFPTSFGKCHAGKSGSYSAIFRKPVKTPSGRETLPSHILRESSKWTYALPRFFLAQKLGFPKVEAIHLYKDQASGKVYGARVESLGKKRDLSFLQLEELVGKGNLVSNDFSASLQGETISFTGYGEGYGVGLCLSSAEIEAKKGKSVEAILRTHFPQIELRNLQREKKGDLPHQVPWD